MKQKKLLLSVMALLVVTIFFTPQMASASPGAILSYIETDLGSGKWKYDYTFYNTFTVSEGAPMNEVILSFPQAVNFSFTSSPPNWGIFPFSNFPPYCTSPICLDIPSFDSSYYIQAGASLGGFSFTGDYRAGDIPFDAYFVDPIDPYGPPIIISGTTVAAPGVTVSYKETNLGGGQWKYDYTLHNTSKGAQSLQEVLLQLPRTVNNTAKSSPTGWNIYTGSAGSTNFFDIASSGIIYEVAAGASLGGFSFTIDYQAGNIPFDAYFGPIVISGVTVSEGTNNPPVANAGGPYTGIEGQSISLNGSGSTDSDGTITKYEWDVTNDGTYDYTSSTPTQNHVYAQQGTYTIKLRVTDNNGATAEATATAYVSDTSPLSDFTGTPLSGAPPLTVNFTNSSTGYDQPLSYAWDFDNNGTTDSTITNPSCLYSSPGIYSVKLTVTDSDGSTNTLIKTDYITVCYSAARIAGATPAYYSTLQSAYDAAANGSIIQSRAATPFRENLNFSLNKSVTLEGGYDCGYTTASGQTTIYGTMTVSNGTVTIGNIVLQ